MAAISSSIVIVLTPSAVRNFSSVRSGSWIRKVATPKSRNWAIRVVSATPIEKSPVSPGVRIRASTIVEPMLRISAV